MSPEQIDYFVSSLSYQDKERILKNLLWTAFGDFDDDGVRCYDLMRTPDGAEKQTIIEALREEFFTIPETEQEDDQ